MEEASLSSTQAPLLPMSEAPVPPPISRSELLARRRAESSNYLQGTYDEWEAANPVWARRLTGTAAAAALGIDTSDGDSRSRIGMMQERRVASRDLAMNSSGYAPTIQAQLCAHEPNQLHTSLARQTEDLPLEYVERPRNSTRLELMGERNRELVQSLTASALEAGPDTNARVYAVRACRTPARPATRPPQTQLAQPPHLPPPQCCRPSGPLARGSRPETRM